MTPPRVTRVDLTGQYQLAVGFSDGTEQRVDLSPVVTGRDVGGFGELRDEKVFGRVQIDPFGSLVWPEVLRLDPWTLHDWHTAGPAWIARVQRIAKQRRWVRRLNNWLFVAMTILFVWSLGAWLGFAGPRPASPLLTLSIAANLVILGALKMRERFPISSSSLPPLRQPPL